MSGLELARALLATRPDLPVIVMSGDTHTLTGMEAGGPAISMLQKPFTAKELRSRVRDALNRPRS
jgi:DNA-binding response OmpR family regulator